MTCIQWSDVTVANMNRAYSLEDQITVLAAYGGLHDFEFTPLINDACTGTISETWDDSGADGTWTYNGGALQGVGGGAAQWYGCLAQTSLNEAGVVVFTKAHARGAALIRAVDENDGYLVYWDSDSIGISWLSSGTPTNLIDLPKVYSGTSEVRIAWREVQYTTADPYRWLFISIWFDGELGLTYGDNINDRTLGTKFGFAAYQSDTITFDNIYAPELSAIGDWASMDENEPPGGALSRLIGQRHVKMFVRYDGTLKVWIPETLTSQESPGNSRIETKDRTLDNRRLLSHARVQGAYVAAEVVDDDLLKLVGHRYQRFDCAHLMTEQECADEATYQLRRAEEMSDIGDYTMPMYVLLEPEDLLTLPDGQYIVTTVSFTGTGAELVAKYGVRKYVT